MLKANLVVMILQTGLIVLLLVRAGNAVPPDDAFLAVSPSEASVRRSDATGACDELTPAPALSEGALRRIVREELVDRIERTLLESEAATNFDAMTPARLQTPEFHDEPVPTDPYRTEYVSQQIDYFVSVGTITSPEMTRLQSEIGRLSQTERQRLLRRLVAALNSGQLKGRL